jgi:hypothetical protein
MTMTWWKRMLKNTSRPATRSRRAGARPRFEELERRLVPTTFLFNTGFPDGKIATIAEPASAHNSQVEFESADDFVLTTETKLDKASFTGLLTGGATPQDVNNVVVEIYRVFPNDSDVGRTSGPPTFSTNQVPTRVNSPADVALDSRSLADDELKYLARVLSTSFATQNSVSSPDKISVASQGNGPATGVETEFDVTFKEPFDLPAGHYFFVPQVGLSDKAPAHADFLWLSAPKPIVPPGSAFPPGVTDLQTWMRDDPPLAPDWLRIGADIIGGAAFNASFSVTGHTVAPKITSLSQDSAPEGSPDLTLTINGSNFTSQSSVLINGLQPLVTTFVNAGQLQALIPAASLADEAHLKLSVLDAGNGLSNAKNFTITDSRPVLTASVSQGQTFQQITLSGLVSDQAVEDHRVRIVWGDGAVDVIDLGVNAGAPFSVTHTFATSSHLHHDTIVVTALDDEGSHSAAQTFDVIV